MRVHRILSNIEFIQVLGIFNDLSGFQTIDLFLKNKKFEQLCYEHLLCQHY